LYDDLVLSAQSPSGAELNLPHPLMAKRDFVMRPLAEIAPDLIHPVLRKTMKKILSDL
ncbi:2-amino-4-hydroxy-6-hydroxymethyldihydropteridine pyrophosphokinase, partial [Bacteroides faecichinchillae]